MYKICIHCTLMYMFSFRYNFIPLKHFSAGLYFYHLHSDLCGRGSFGYHSLHLHSPPEGLSQATLDFAGSSCHTVWVSKSPGLFNNMHCAFRLGKLLIIHVVQVCQWGTTVCSAVSGQDAWITKPMPANVHCIAAYFQQTYDYTQRLMLAYKSCQRD